MKNAIKLILLGLIFIGVSCSRTVLNLGSDFPYNGTILRNLLIKKRQPKRIRILG